MELTGATLRFDLTGGALDKGILIRGDIGAIEEVDARVMGGPAARLPVLVGDGKQYTDGPVRTDSLQAGSWPRPPDGPWLRLWYPRQEPAPSPRAGEDPETLRRLRALGYVD